jgi:alpha-beta hydrolase superfamily lysophospholipase
MSTSSLPLSNDSSNKEHYVEGFHVGFYHLHPDVSLNYQKNRFSTGEPDMIEAMRAVAPRIHDYNDYTREFLALSEQALARGQTLQGAYYLRSAEFYMFNNDPRKQPARRQFLHLIREHFGVRASEHYAISYQGSTLSAYRFTPLQPKGTILLCGGFDSYIEEVFSLLFFLRNAGFDVIGFEGPGQGVPLEEAHLPMTPEWEKPVKAVLDYFQLDDVTLIGYSLGGCLAIRAAAYEPRVRRVITDDILTDFFETVMGQVSATARTELSLLLKAGAAHAVNLLFERAMKQSLVVEWGIQQGMHVTGTTSPYEFLKQGQLYRTDDVSALVEQDVLLMAGAEDHYVPLHQFYDQIRLLSHVRSLTARLFSRQEQAQNHAQVGNIGLSLRVITNWIESIQAR